MIGKIIKIISNDYTVLSDNQKYICKARGKFRALRVTPMVGDNVKFDEQKKYILDILTRKNELNRPMVSNIDQALIVVSVKEPDLDLYLLDKLLCLIEFHNIEPIICFTKLDLLEDTKSILELKKYYQKIGYRVFDNSELKEISKVFKDKISVITGQSGAGKSTLLNLLNEELHLDTKEISKALGRGRHTTRHTELLPLLEGWCADTPGFSSLAFYDMTDSDIRDNIIEFNEYRENCEYKDCMHKKEENCEIKRQVGKNILPSRYENYLKFIDKKEG